MGIEGDASLIGQLEPLRAAHFERLIDTKAIALIEQELREQDEASIEATILDAADVLRSRIIDAQSRHLRIRQATRLGKWLMTRRTLPEIRFGIDSEDGWDDGDLTVATAPLLATTEDTVDGKVKVGWVFKLESPMPGAMVSYGRKEPPVHAYAHYDNSTVSIFRVAEDVDTGAQAKEQWFTVDPTTGDISCWKLAQERNDLYVAQEIEEMESIPEDEQRTIFDFDDDSGELLGFEFRELSPEAEAREQKRQQRHLERLKEQYAPDLETGLLLLGIIRGATQELY